MIPCFNADRWVRHCIESALEQSVAAKEVIVVDDGSTDGSLNIIRSFGNRIRFEAGPNRGGNVARNRLLGMAKGEWVQFLDADDYLRPNKIKQQMESCDEDVDVIYSPVTIETWNSDCVEKTTIHGPNPNQSLEEQWIRWNVGQTGSVLWRRTCLQQIGGWNEQYPCCQDNEVILRAICKRLTFKFCPDAGAVYRIWSEDTVCRKNPARVIQYRTDLIHQMLGWLESKAQIMPSHRKAAGQAFFEMARTLAKSDIEAGKQYAMKCQKDRLFNITGPAAPGIYRLLYSILGFAATERLAAIRR